MYLIENTETLACERTKQEVESEERVSRRTRIVKGKGSVGKYYYNCQEAHTCRKRHEIPDRVKGYLTAQCPEKKRWSTARPQLNNRWPRDNTGRFLPRMNNRFQNRNFQPQRDNNPFCRQAAVTNSEPTAVRQVDLLPPQRSGSSGMYIIQEPKEPSVEE